MSDTIDLNTPVKGKEIGLGDPSLEAGPPGEAKKARLIRKAVALCTRVSRSG